MTESSDLVLSPSEIYAITHYKLPRKQIEALAAMGIPAQLRKIDNTVCVLRAHVTNPSGEPADMGPAGPVRKSVREREEPQLKSTRRLQQTKGGGAG
ncbi:DUF4224 domain-containing protein [Herbaspirillum huttiense]|uniref:DUF4224 domain-containing protein n=1 Tax=Herbaspirillum huttiense TaxID=863372 RepID=UPI003B3A744F